jgi:hypothetical protein
MIYPLLTWLVTVPAFTLTVTANGVTEVLNVPAGSYYGWKTTGTGFGGVYAADAASLGSVLAAVFATHSEMPACAAFYGMPVFVGQVIGGLLAPEATVGVQLTDVTDFSVDATSNAVALRMFGLEVGDSCSSDNVIIARRTAGVWRPMFAPPAFLEPVMVAVGSGAVSEYNPAAFDRILLSGRLVWSLRWEYVPAADITRALSPLNDYLTAANRAAGDTAGTLDDALWYAANTGSWLLALPPQGTDAIDYRGVVMPADGNIERGAYTTEASAGARLYIVTLSVIQTAAYDPGTPL